MALIPPPDRSQPLLDEGLTPTLRAQVFFEAVALLAIIEGTGTPEGVVEARPAREYMDTTGTTGNIKYIKRDADIAGDRTKGWILI